MMLLRTSDTIELNGIVTLFNSLLISCMDNSFCYCVKEDAVCSLPISNSSSHDLNKVDLVMVKTSPDGRVAKSSVGTWLVGTWFTSRY